MAQIVTITNPLTGQPVQVDQLEHTAQQIDDGIKRALEYGLGSIGKRVTDMDNAKESGFYSALGASNLPPNVESVQYGSVLVLCSQENRVTQIYFQDVTGGTGAIAVRRLNGNGWSAWEFINPPMTIGVEYRTTERYLGKPVYVKLVNFGAGPNNTEKKVAHGASNAFVIDYGGYMSDNKGTLSIPWLNYSSLSVSSSDIVIVTSANYSLYTAYVWIKYYKTTD